MSSTSKRERQKAGHRARLDAERAAFARYRRRRRLTVVVLSVGGVLVVAALIVALSRGGDSSTAASTTTSTVAAPESAAGKPCVALADPLPTGAPDVPVPVGDPPTELVTEDLTVGTGEAAVLGGEVTVNYIGVNCSTGEIFDSSYSRSQPLTATLAPGGLIQGWIDGIPGMQPGGSRLLVIPPDLAYGSSSSGPGAPDETLVFVIDLVSASPATTTTTAP